MFISNKKSINNQISVALKNKNDTQENWMQYPLNERCKTNGLSYSINNLSIDDLSNRLKEMRNAMMKSRFK
jgi:hypothetical protein